MLDTTQKLLWFSLGPNVNVIFKTGPLFWRPIHRVVPFEHVKAVHVFPWID